MTVTMANLIERNIEDMRKARARARKADKEAHEARSRAMKQVDGRKG